MSIPMYYEVDSYSRSTGRVWSQVQDPLVGAIRTEPFCFRNVTDIKGEIDARRDKGDNECQVALAVIEENRNCASWYPYNPGLSSKDHFDQMKLELLEQSRREFELRLEKERKDFDLRMLEMGRKAQEHSREVAERSDRFNRRMTLFFIILALLELFTTLLTLAYPNGIPWIINLFSAGR